MYGYERRALEVQRKFKIDPTRVRTPTLFLLEEYWLILGWTLFYMIFIMWLHISIIVVCSKSDLQIAPIFNY